MPTTKTSRFRIPYLKGGHGDKPKDSTYAIPPVRGDSTMSLADIVGSTAGREIEATGQLVFHAVGDTGRGPHTAEQSVAEAMARDIDPKSHAKSPAFLLHLGDVIYGDGKRDLYDDEFYRPYADYHNKVIAIPGNHDSEEGVTMDKVSLEAFRENFCAPPGKQPPLAARFNCQMVNQPGVYWLLETKLLHLVGLYSNAAETFGILGNYPQKAVTNVGTAQLDWLAARLKAIKDKRSRGERKALIFAMHHPPYAQGLQPSQRGHAGSPEMLEQMDSLCAKFGFMPDLVVSAHTHCYAHYTRHFKSNGLTKDIPYLVAGAGGFGSEPAPPNFGYSKGGVTYENGAPPKGLAQAHDTQNGYGFLTVTVKPKNISILYTMVQDNHRQPFETTNVPLN
jgi:Icc-related predicted phosphoesterase